MVSLPSQYFTTYEDILLAKKREEDERIRAEMARERQMDQWAREDADPSIAANREAVAQGRHAMVDGGGFRTSGPLLRAEPEINENSPFYRSVVGGPTPLPKPEEVATRSVFSVPEERIDPVTTQSIVPASPEERAPSLKAPPEEELGLLGGFFQKLGASTPEARQALGSSLIRAGGAMMVAGGQGEGVGSAIGRGLIAGTDGYDESIENQQKTEANRIKIAAAQDEIGKKKRADEISQQIAVIYRQAGPYGLSRQQQAKIAALQQEAGDLTGARATMDGANALQDAVAKNGGQIDENGKIVPVAGFRELVATNSGTKTQQNVGQYYDPKTGNRYSMTFNPTTGRQTTFDASGNIVSDPSIINGLREDSATRDKANLSLTTGEEAVDKKYAEDFHQYAANSAENKAQLTNIRKGIDILKTNPGSVGGVSNLLPNSVRNFVNSDGVVAQQNIESAVLQTLRQTLGAQFTEKEGERIMSITFNPLQSADENIRRAQILAGKLESLQRANEEKYSYYQTNGTLKGYKTSIVPTNLYDDLNNTFNSPKTGTFRTSNGRLLRAK